MVSIPYMKILLRKNWCICCTNHHTKRISSALSKISTTGTEDLVIGGVAEKACATQNSYEKSDQVHVDEQHLPGHDEPIIPLEYEHVVSECVEVKNEIDREPPANPGPREDANLSTDISVEVHKDPIATIEPAPTQDVAVKVDGHGYEEQEYVVLPSDNNTDIDFIWVVTQKES